MAIEECQGVIIGKNPAGKKSYWQVQVDQPSHRLNKRKIDVHYPEIELEKGMRVRFRVVGETNALKAISVRRIR